MRYALIFVFAASIGLAAGPDYIPSEVLGRAIEKAAARARNIPNYTCVETVTREYFAPIAASLVRDCAVLLQERRHPTPDMVLRPYSTDRLRLDVTMSSRGEIFSWSGASQFEDRDISQLVRSGPMGTGSFGGFLHTVFSSDVTKFVFTRSIVEGGRTLMEYAFQVAQPESHYKVKAGDSWVFIPYSGTFQADAETADVLRMSITTGESPSATGICQLTTTLDFAKVQIGSEEFMLPQRTGQRFIYPHVEETENTTLFAKCREFRGESTLTFSPEEPAQSGLAPKGAAPKQNYLPGGLAFTFTLNQPIPTDTAAAGDPFSGKLTDPLRDAKGKVLVPKGATIEGRLLRVQSFARPPETVVVLRPELIRTGGGSLLLKAARDWTNLLAQRRRVGKAMEILVPLRGEESSGAFSFTAEHMVIPAGFRSDWKTVFSQPVTLERR